LLIFWKKRIRLKKVLLSTILSSALLIANSEFSTTYTYKDYDNSKTKIDGKTIDYRFAHKFSNSELTINYEDSATKRENKVTHKNIDTLEIEKISAKYLYKLNEQVTLKTSFLNIEDNLAVTDNGKVYGIGTSINITPSDIVKLDTYLSDYDDFNVNQYDLTLIKKFNLNNINFSGQLGSKYTNINGEKYGNYNFEDNEYLLFLAGINMNYNGYYTGVNYLFGDRLFTVQEDGLKESFVFNLGKKFKTIDIYTRYTYLKGDELPENKDNVSSDFISIGLNYKFNL
jgi:hypothetical protein